MVNDPKDDNDLENKENSKPADASDETESAGDEAIKSSESGESSGTDDVETVSSAEIEDAVLLQDTDSIDADNHDPAPSADSQSAQSAPTTTGGGSTFAMIAGGLIAGGIGFLVATFAVPEGWPNGTSNSDGELASQLARTSDELATQSSRLDELQAELARAQEATQDGVNLAHLDEAIATMTADLDALGQQVDGLSGTLQDLDARIAKLESRPALGTADGSDAMSEQIQAFQAELDSVTDAARNEISAAQQAASEQIAAAQAELSAAQERAQTIENEAEAAAQAARQAAAISAVRAALDSGEPFADELALLSDPPEPLISVAVEGVPTLASLQDDFAPAARTALSSAQVVPENAGAGDRLAAFLRRQTNARSLAPREGDDADAILSRAEAAINRGDIAAAITEIDLLPDEAKSAFSAWLGAAETRQSALLAVETLDASTNEEG